MAARGSKVLHHAAECVSKGRKRTTFTHAKHKQLKSKYPFAKFKDTLAFIPVPAQPSPIAGDSGMLGA